MISVFAKIDTWVKLSTLQSSELAADEKLQLKKGQKIVDLISCSLVKGHYQLEVVPNEYAYVWANDVDISPPLYLLTASQLHDIALETNYSKLDILLPELNKTLAKYEINTPLRICHFIAQVAHESDGFNTTEEYASGADYEWREDLGNVYTGDGVKFKGRGLIQVTGRYNYRELGKYLNIDLEENPYQVALPELACSSAGWYWETRNLNSHADQDNFERITRIINGGKNGWDDRLNYLNRAKKVFDIQ